MNSKKVHSTEILRMTLNHSIDLLHKVASQRLQKEEAKAEIYPYLLEYFLVVEGLSEVILHDEMCKGEKVRLEEFLECAYAIFDQVASEQVPLYEGIMLMNKVIVHRQQEENPLSDKELVRIKTTSQGSVKNLIEDVMAKQRELDQSIKTLNDALGVIGFELRPLKH